MDDHCCPAALLLSLFAIHNDTHVVLVVLVNVVRCQVWHVANVDVMFLVMSDDYDEHLTSSSRWPFPFALCPSEFYDDLWTGSSDFNRWNKSKVWSGLSPCTHCKTCSHMYVFYGGCEVTWGSADCPDDNLSPHLGTLGRPRQELTESQAVTLAHSPAYCAGCEWEGPSLRRTAPDHSVISLVWQTCGTGDSRQGTGDRGQGTGDRRQETGDRRQEIGDRGQVTLQGWSCFCSQEILSWLLQIEQFLYHTIAGC